MDRLLPRTRLVIAAIAVALWFGGLNLCAFKLLGMASVKSSGCPCCHTAGNSAKPAPAFCDKYSGQEAAPNPHLPSILLACAGLPVIEIFSFGDVLTPKGTVFAVPRTTHPPGAISFAELILQRSLFTQAPPFA